MGLQEPATLGYPSEGVGVESSILAINEKKMCLLWKGPIFFFSASSKPAEGSSVGPNCGNGYMDTMLILMLLDAMSESVDLRSLCT